MDGSRQYEEHQQVGDVNADDLVMIYSASLGQNVLVKQRDLVGIADFGWTPAGEEWLYSSFDSATRVGVMTVPTGATSKYSVGMRIRFEQATGGTKYGVITVVGTTSLTFEMTATQALDNEAITDPVYSSLYAPYGLPFASQRSTQVAIGVIQASTLSTTGNKNISGVGITPRVVRFTTLPSDSNLVTRTGAGAMSLTTQFATSTGGQSAQNAAGGTASATDACILYVNSSGGVLLKASYVSLNADGFTINVSVAGSYSVAYEAYA